MRHIAVSILVLVSNLSQPSLAASSTSTGQVSVAQVVEMIEKSGSDRAFRNIALAYLSGVGEAAGILIGEAASRGISHGCQHPLELSSTQALAAVKASSGEGAWQETPATPVILADMLDRAGCK